MRRTRTSLIAGIVASAVVLAAVPAAIAGLHTNAVAGCARGQLGVRANGTDGAAGTIHGAWVFTNLSKTAACTLSGYPGMQLYGRAGRAIPTTVKHTLRPKPRIVRLAPGGSATFYSSYNDVGSGSHACPTSAVARIAAPKGGAALYIPLYIPAQLQACGGIVNVSAVLAGVHPA